MEINEIRDSRTPPPPPNGASQVDQNGFSRCSEMRIHISSSYMKWECFVECRWSIVQTFQLVRSCTLSLSKYVQKIRKPI